MIRIQLPVRIIALWLALLMLLAWAAAFAEDPEAEIVVPRGGVDTQLLPYSKRTLREKGYYPSDLSEEELNEIVKSAELDDSTMVALSRLAAEYPDVPAYNGGNDGITSKARWDLAKDPDKIKPIATPRPDETPPPDTYRNIPRDDITAGDEIERIQSRLIELKYLDQKTLGFKARELNDVVFDALKDFANDNSSAAANLYSDDMVSADLQTLLFSELALPRPSGFAEKLRRYFMGKVSIFGLGVPRLVLWIVGILLLAGCVVAVIHFFGPGEKDDVPENQNPETPRPGKISMNPLRHSKKIHFEITYKGAVTRHDEAIEDVLKIGRNVGNFPLNMEDTEISRRHCELYYEGKTLMFRDYSSYGSYINGEFFNNTQRPLKSGDVIVIGEHTIKVSW